VEKPSTHAERRWLSTGVGNVGLKRDIGLCSENCICARCVEAGGKMTDDEGRMDCPFTGALTDCALCPEEIKRRCTPDFINKPVAVVKSESDLTTMIYDRDVKDEASGNCIGVSAFSGGAKPRKHPVMISMRFTGGQMVYFLTLENAKVFRDVICDAIKTLE
jgi:hypothetical protein